MLLLGKVCVLSRYQRAWVPVDFLRVWVACGYVDISGAGICVQHDGVEVWQKLRASGVAEEAMRSVGDVLARHGRAAWEQTPSAAGAVELYGRQLFWRIRSGSRRVPSASQVYKGSYRAAATFGWLVIAPMLCALSAVVGTACFLWGILYLSIRGCLAVARLALWVYRGLIGLYVL